MERLIGELDAAKLRGTVIVVPVINIPSFELKVAHLNPVDGKNMNRFYPGKADGTQTERASYAITKAVVEPADHLIDFHGGDVDESLRPYSYWTVTGNAAQDSASKAMVLAFGLDHIVVSRDRPTDTSGARYLENNATTRGKPSFTAEAGHHGTVEAADVDTLVQGSLRVMAHLGMLERAFTPVRHPVWITELHSVTGSVGGIFYPLVRRSQRVTKGTRLGYTTDWFGRELEAATAPADGVVLYVRPVPSMMKGETIASIGVVGKP
jgi:predicted deacylase